MTQSLRQTGRGVLSPTARTAIAHQIDVGASGHLAFECLDRPQQEPRQCHLPGRRGGRRRADLGSRPARGGVRHAANKIPAAPITAWRAATPADRQIAVQAARMHTSAIKSTVRRSGSSGDSWAVSETTEFSSGGSTCEGTAVPSRSGRTGSRGTGPLEKQQAASRRMSPGVNSPASIAHAMKPVPPKTCNQAATHSKRKSSTDSVSTPFRQCRQRHLPRLSGRPARPHRAPRRPAIHPMRRQQPHPPPDRPSPEPRMKSTLRSIS